ncbi:MAG: glycerate kinase [bacterium]
MTLTIGIAPDSFKGTLTAEQAVDAMARGVLRWQSDATVIRMPMADGGEGTASLLGRATGGAEAAVDCTDPLGRPITAAVWRLGAGDGDGDTWAVDTAAASGLTLLGARERRPLRTCSRGTGELIRCAVDRGARTVVLGLGGSATVDGGKGICQALGFRWLDSGGRELAPGGGSLTALARIDADGVGEAVRQARVRVAYDVRNPLCGPNGAAEVFGPQKGATPEQVHRLADGLERMADVLSGIGVGIGIDARGLPGAGAAGGIGATLHALLGATLEPGAELVFQSAGYAAQLARCDLVLVGEGRLDGQTAAGKAPALVAAHANAASIPVLAVAGCFGAGADTLSGIADREAVSAVPPATLPSPTQAAAELAAATHRLLLRYRS